MSVSRRGLALVAVLTLLSFAHTPADAAKGKPVRAPRADADRDGLTNRFERRARTKPRRADTDRDGTRDGLEDGDGDGVDNRTEQLARTHPARTNSDRDRTPDGDEDPDDDGLRNGGESAMGTHPRKADTDGDGYRDPDELSGTVTVIDGDRVTIALSGGGELIGRIDSASEVYCDEIVEDAGDEEEWLEDWLEEDGWIVEEEFRRSAPLVGAPCFAIGATVLQMDVTTAAGTVYFPFIDLLGG